MFLEYIRIYMPNLNETSKFILTPAFLVIGCISNYNIVLLTLLKLLPHCGCSGAASQSPMTLRVDALAVFWSSWLGLSSSSSVLGEATGEGPGQLVRRPQRMLKPHPSPAPHLERQELLLLRV